MRMNYRTTLGRQGLPYGTPAAEEMISDRMKKLAAKTLPELDALAEPTGADA
jgi:hypothetical protein